MCLVIPEIKGGIRSCKCKLAIDVFVRGNIEYSGFFGIFEIIYHDRHPRLDDSMDFHELVKQKAEMLNSLES